MAAFAKSPNLIWNFDWNFDTLFRITGNGPAIGASG
jgi:hypothetical protein